MRYLLVDFDSVIYTACLTSKDNDEEGFQRDMGEVVRSIHASLDWMIEEMTAINMKPDLYKLFIGSKTNFRKIIYSDYKAKARIKPPLLKEAMEYAKDELNAFSVDGLEADDLVLATKINLEKDWENEVIIGFIDKDLMQIDGLFFDYYYNRKDRLLDVSKEQAVQNFWTQMLTGDTADNIIGIKGVGIKTAQKILKGQTTHFGALRVVYAKYLEYFGRKGREKFMLNYRLLRMVTEGVPTPNNYNIIL